MDNAIINSVQLNWLAFQLTVSWNRFNPSLDKAYKARNIAQKQSGDFDIINNFSLTEANLILILPFFNLGFAKP